MVEDDEPVEEREAHVGEPEIVGRGVRQALGVADRVVGGVADRPTGERGQFGEPGRPVRGEPPLQLGERVVGLVRLHVAAAHDADGRPPRLETHERVGGEEAVAADPFAADDALEQAPARAAVEPAERGHRGEAVGEQPSVHRHEAMTGGEGREPGGVGMVHRGGRGVRRAVAVNRLSGGAAGQHPGAGIDGDRKSPDGYDA